MKGMRAATRSVPSAAVAALLFGGLTLGQLVRLHPFGSTSGGAVEALDLALVASVVTLLAMLIRAGQVRAWVSWLRHHAVWRWSVWFVGWAAASLAINLPRYTAKQDLVAVSYFGRLLAVFLLLWLSAWFADYLRQAYLRGFAMAATALLVLGYLQLVFVSNFAFMAQRGGWDPHLGRMLSTFFDPNYFGVFLVLVMVIALAKALGSSTRRLPWWALFAASWLGLYFTFSRSAFVAGVIAVVGFSLRRSWKLALTFLVVFLLILASPNRLGQRFSDSKGIATTGSAKAGVDDVCGSAGRNCDASGSARIVSFKRGLNLAARDVNLLTGVGYNAYGFALVNHGLLAAPRLSVHSSQGSDSSLLNILVTTGLPGLMLFGGFLLAVVRRLLFVPRENLIASALGWFTVAWIAASFLNNSLLYPSILVPWAALLAVCLPGGKRVAAT